MEDPRTFKQRLKTTPANVLVNELVAKFLSMSGAKPAKEWLNEQLSAAEIELGLIAAVTLECVEQFVVRNAEVNEFQALKAMIPVFLLWIEKKVTSELVAPSGEHIARARRLTEQLDSVPNKSKTVFKKNPNSWWSPVNLPMPNHKCG